MCENASKIQSINKMEGGCNRVFCFTMDSGEEIIARVPTSIAGPPRLTTNSEVATMAYSTYIILTVSRIHLLTVA